MNKKITNLFIISLFCFKLSALDRAFDALLPFIPEDPIVIEAGAYYGDDTSGLSQRWPRGSIYAFEYNPLVFKKLEDNTTHLANVHRFPLALGGKNGIADFFLSCPSDLNNTGCDAQSSLLPPSNDPIWEREWKHINFRSPIKVNVVTIDSWAEENKITHVDFLWLDTQGSEYNILKASPKILATINTIKTEISDQPFYAGCVCFSEYAAWLESEGFVCIYRDSEEHGDAAFVRRELL